MDRKIGDRDLAEKVDGVKDNDERRRSRRAPRLVAKPRTHFIYIYIYTYIYIYIYTQDGVGSHASG